MTHGDLIPGNVLVSNGHLAGILDVGGKFLAAYLAEFRDHIVRVLTLLPRQAQVAQPQ
jgi:aminoglycoside phosphotransferase (APT) family kinase protein